MIKVKNGVTPVLIILVCAAANEAVEQGVNITITSGTDGVHMPNSKHYTYEAIDIRSSNFPTLSAKTKFLNGLSKRLGPNYDCILEKDHFHCEYDPKVV